MTDVANALANKSKRIVSIDIFRALIMFLMIFVNDLWSVSGVPHWLEHAARDEDMLGFSDIIFPSFLFILGMSIPLAINIRLRKNESKLNIFKHIVIRSMALLIMGVFTVNTEYGIASSVGLSKPIYVLLMLTGFFLVWNVYPSPSNNNRKLLYKSLKYVGLLLLLFLAIIFRSKDGAIFQPYWWGILGLIGWTYLICATIYLFSEGRKAILIVASICFTLLCIAGANKWLGSFHGIIPGNGCFHAITLNGILLSILFTQCKESISLRNKYLITAATGTLFLILGIISHNYWIISKLQETPTWLFFCSSIACFSYLGIYWLTDIQKKGDWFNIIKPAGTATLTCYLVPYMLYALFSLVQLNFNPDIFTGSVGLIKCFLFSFLTVAITAILVRLGVKLKI